MSKKLLFLLHLPPPFYGVTRVNKDILEGEALKRFSIDVISINTAKTQQSVGKKTPDKLAAFFSIFLALLKRLLWGRYELCYFSLTPTGGAFYKDFILALMVKAFKVKLVYHLHGKGIAGQNGLPKELLYKIVFKNSKVIIMSELLFSDIEKYVDRSRIYVLHNGIKAVIDEDFFKRVSAGRIQPKTVNPVRKFEKSFASLEMKSLTEPKKETFSNGVNLLFLSNITQSKGVYIALEAAKRLKIKGYDFKLYFAGNWFDILEQEFRQRLKQLSIEDKVEYLGFKEAEEKNRVLAEADIFVYPTLNDAFPLVVLEAMHFGLPIVSSREGAIGDIIEDGVSGFLVPKKDTDALVQKIELLINNVDLRLKIGRAARERSLKKYTFDRFEKGLINIFNENINS